MKPSLPYKIVTYVVLTLWALIVIFPLWTLMVNSFKPKRDIFKDPFSLPTEVTVDGYLNAWTDSNFSFYFRNSFFITTVSLFLILFLGSIAAYSIAKWRSKIPGLFYIYFIAGLMIPLRLGTINLLQTIKAMGLLDTVFSLIPVYVAMGLPIAVFVLTDFIRALPDELFEAAKIDGANRFGIYLKIVIPLIRPALSTVAIFNLIPIWNDLWFPLIFIRTEDQRTLILGISLLFGQYQSNWTYILSALAISAVPVLVLYLAFAKQFIKGLTAGAVKG
ncbi:MAG: carbohydrate ABC transporter permease [Spirochaetales bacterium]|nr:carbohydrate ABC transporter permease [Spirochaetales bacterium]